MIGCRSRKPSRLLVAAEAPPPVIPLADDCGTCDLICLNDEKKNVSRNTSLSLSLSLSLFMSLLFFFISSSTPFLSLSLSLSFSVFIFLCFEPVGVSPSAPRTGASVRVAIQGAEPESKSSRLASDGCDAQKQKQTNKQKKRHEILHC